MARHPSHKHHQTLNHPCTDDSSFLNPPSRLTNFPLHGLLNPVNKASFMLPENQQVVSPERFDELFREQANIAEFPKENDELEYERRDSFLIHLIRREVTAHFGPDSGNSPFVGEDWWPDHTRHMEISSQHCTPSFLTALHALLTDDYRDYRIQLCVYVDPMEGNSYIGSMALSADHVLIEQKLHDLLYSHRNA